MRIRISSRRILSHNEFLFSGIRYAEKIRLVSAVSIVKSLRLVHSSALREHNAAKCACKPSIDALKPSNVNGAVVVIYLITMPIRLNWFAFRDFAGVVKQPNRPTGEAFMTP